MASTFYKNIYTDSNDTKSYCVRGFFPPLSPQDIDNLNRPFDDADVRSALFNMGKFKAPGSDGFQATLLSKSMEHYWAFLL
ncbi:Retrovirus-related Pol polyprotein LINE-1 [Sesbania bispinosa]|nr:Retrovirus-related Pol polyprotein LINE-1 [Sesbania bispinosa]